MKTYSDGLNDKDTESITPKEMKYRKWILHGYIISLGQARIQQRFKEGVLFQNGKTLKSKFYITNSDNFT